MSWLDSLSTRLFSTTQLRKYAKPLMAVYVLLFIVLGTVTLSHYGFTWDEANGDLFIGERYLHYFLTFNPAYLNFDNPDLDIHQRPFDLYYSPYRDRPNEFPPVGNTLSAITMEIFGNRLGWLDPIDAFHLAKVLMAGVLLWFLFVFAAPRLGTLTAGLAVLILSTFPRFWGDMHFNPLDIPETVFFALTIFAFYLWTERPSWQRAALAGILMGGAMGNKGNALFIPPILFVGMFPLQPIPQLWNSVTQHLRKYAGHYVLMVAAALFVHFITWPYLYADPLRLLDYYRYLFTVGYLTAPKQWNLDPVIQTITTMPEVDLVLLVVGIVFAVWAVVKKNSILMRLLLVWFAVPILRGTLPGSASFDGIRHFEEFLPAACLLAAYGGIQLVNFAASRTGKKMLAAGVVALLLAVNIGVIEAQYFPYEYLYYNSLVGGLKGAQQITPDNATDYWGGSYRPGIQWLNYNAPRGAQLHVAIAPWIVRLAAPIWLRSDIGLIEAPVVKLKVEQGFPVYVMFITRPGWYNSIAAYCVQNLKPVHQIAVDGATILVIYKLGNAPGIPN